MVGTKFGDRIAEYSEYVRINVGISTKGKTSYILQVGDQPLDQLRFAMESTGAVRQLMMMGLVFNTTIKFNSPAAEVQPMIDAMEDFMQEANAKLPDGCKGIQTAVRYRGVRTEQVLLESAISGTLLSLLLAFIIILAATMNWITTLYSCISILGVVSAVIAAMVCLGWTLGVIQSICITIVVGLSVDYTIHLVRPSPSNLCVVWRCGFYHCAAVGLRN